MRRLGVSAAACMRRRAGERLRHQRVCSTTPAPTAPTKGPTSAETTALGKRRRPGRASEDEIDVVLAEDIALAVAALLVEAEAVPDSVSLPPVARRSGLRRTCCPCCGVPDLPPVLDAARRKLQKLAKVKMAAVGEAGRDAHESYLTQIFEALAGTPPPPHPGV